MKFTNTIGSLGKIESGDEQFLLSTILGIMVLDFDLDVKKGQGVKLDRLPVSDEEAPLVMRNLINVANMINHIYRNNKPIFSDEQSTARMEMIQKKYSELIEAADRAEEEYKQLQENNRAIDRENQRLRSLLDGKKSLQEHLEEKNALQISLTTKLNEIDALNREIERLKRNTIPETEHEITFLREKELPDIQEKLRKNEERRDSLQKDYDYYCEKSEEEHKNLQTLEIKIRVKKEEKEETVREIKEKLIAAEEWEKKQNEVIDNLRKEESDYRLQDKKNKNRIEELNHSINILKEEGQAEGEEIDRLREEQRMEEDITNGIRGARVRLESELNALRARNGEEKGKNKDIQDEIDLYRNQKNNAAQMRQELISQRDKMKEEYHNTLIDIDNNNEEIEALQKHLNEKQDENAKYKKKIIEEKINFQKAQNDTRMMMKNRENQMAIFEKQQKAFAGRIGKLIEDEKMFMFANTSERAEIENKLLECQASLESQLKTEIVIYQELLEYVESQIG